MFEKLEKCLEILSKILYVMFNLQSYIQPLYAIAVLSGISIFAFSNSATNGMSPDIDVYLILNITFLFMIVGAFIMLACTHMYENPNVSWWSLSVLIEQVKEHKAIKIYFIILGIALFIMQLMVFGLCGSYSTGCNINYFPTTNAPVSKSLVLSMSEALNKASCPDYMKHYSFETNQILDELKNGVVQDPMDFNIYLTLQAECFKAEEKCQPVCSTRPSNVSFAFAFILGFLGLVGIPFFDSAAYFGIPTELTAFNKVTIPKWGSLHKFWESSTELVSGLQTIVILRHSAKDPNAFEKIKELRSDLPWSWVEKLEETDYKQLEDYFLPEKQSRNAVHIKMKGPARHLVDMLIKLLSINDVKTTIFAKDKYDNLQPSLFVFHKLGFFTFFGRIKLEPDSDLEVFIMCMSNKTPVQLVPEEIEKLKQEMGSLHPSIGIEPCLISGHFNTAKFLPLPLLNIIKQQFEHNQTLPIQI